MALCWQGDMCRRTQGGTRLALSRPLFWLLPWILRANTLVRAHHGDLCLCSQPSRDWYSFNASLGYIVKTLSQETKITSQPNKDSLICIHLLEGWRSYGRSHHLEGPLLLNATKSRLKVPHEVFFFLTFFLFTFLCLLHHAHWFYLHPCPFESVLWPCNLPLKTK